MMNTLRFCLTIYVDGGTTNVWCETHNQALIAQGLLESTPGVDRVRIFDADEGVRRPVSKAKKLNTTQLAALRGASETTGLIPCDRCTGKALADRGFASEVRGSFYVTPAGAVRATRAADVAVHRDGRPDDPSLMRDLATGN